MTVLPEHELGVRPLQAEIFRISGQGGSAVRRLDRGTVSLVVLNQLAARILLRFTNRAPTVSTAAISGDYDAVVLPGSVAVFPVERYKWIAAVVDYAGAVAAQDNQLQAIGLESIVAYQPGAPGPAYGITPAGLFVPLAVDAAGRLATSPAAPAGVTELLNSAAAAAAAMNAGLANVAGQTTYITGFEVTGGGATAASLISVAVNLGASTLFYVMAIPAGPLVGVTPLLVEYSRPLPAPLGGALSVSVPSFGAGNTSAAISVHGFRQ